MFVYVGTFTVPPQGHGEGITVCRFDPETGTLRHLQTVTSVVNPSWVALDRQHSYLYAVNAVDDGKISAFARDAATGMLTEINQQSSHGAGPCSVSLDASGRYALTTNYRGGTLTALPIRADGGLEPATSVIRREGSSVNLLRQEKPHPHMIAPTPDGRLILATDLGTDEVLVFRLNLTTGQLLPNDLGPARVAATPGAGPRHVAFDPNGRTLYVINELDSTVTVYDYDAEGGDLRPRQSVSTLPPGWTGENICAQVIVSPDGRFVYGSNRGHDSITIFAADEESGELTVLGYESTRGQMPRNIAIDPTATWLLAANLDSDTIVSFRRDRATGTLTAAGPVFEVLSPTCIVFSNV